jgi:hypothetical protein
LDDNSYIPRGSTPLHSCIKLAIDRIREVVGVGSDDLISQCNDIMTGNDTTVLFIILTDGVDNMSTSEDKSYVAEFIQTLTDSGRWTFTYAGANQIVQKLVEEFHFRPENVVSYAATDMGMSAHTSALTRGLDTYYAARSVAADTFNATDVSFYDNKDEEQK